MISLSALKALLKERLKASRRWRAKTFHAFDARRLQLALAELAIETGDTVLAHSSFDAFEGFQGKPSEVIQVLQNSVGPQGLLMMPTMTFTGSAIDMVKSKPLFDVLRTPSRMGVLTELFRRSPGVVRSVHPTHPVVCWGADAATVAAGHHLSSTPCGRGTPFEALLQRRGKIVLMGTGINVLTFYHHLEEVFESALPVKPFTEEVFELPSKAADGQLLLTRCRLFAPEVSRRRNLGKLMPFLKQVKAWREARVGRLTIVALSATGVEAAVRAMIEQGVSCYE